MAGAGFKTFNTGDVLTASDVNTYLMQQTTMVFADASARSTALGANVAEGMLSYLKDTNAVERYDGSSWGAIGAGDIEGVTAGTGLTGGGTSGTVTLSLDQANYGGGQYSAGKNKIINGDFGIWQRGTSFALANATNTFTADRFLCQQTFTSGSPTVTQQTFTAGTAPVSGYEGTYFLRHTLGTGNLYFATFQRIEDVRVYAGQTVTFSFWAKASASITAITIFWSQNFGSGGSATVTNTTTISSIGTSWARYTASISIPSVSGKTIGTGSFLTIGIDTSNAPSLTNGMTIDTWGWQLEAGSTATPFQTATGNPASELAACQRYYYRLGGNQVYETFGNGMGFSSTLACINFKHPVSMRVAPSSIDYSTIANWDGTGIVAITSAAIGTNQSAKDYTVVNMTSASSLVQYRPYSAMTNNSLSGYIGFSAEL